jgi:hypothetical protein
MICGVKAGISEVWLPHLATVHRVAKTNGILKVRTIPLQTRLVANSVHVSLCVRLTVLATGCTQVDYAHITQSSCRFLG